MKLMTYIKKALIVFASVTIHIYACSSLSIFRFIHRKQFFTLIYIYK